MEGKKKYTEQEALDYIFNLSVNDLEKTAYNRVKQCKKRHKKGELNRNAIESLLLEFGFSRPDVLYYDKGKNIHLKNAH